MSNGVNVSTAHSLVGGRFTRQATKIANVYETLIMQPDHAHPRLQWVKNSLVKTSNSGISCRNWRASWYSINSFTAETKSVNSNF